MFASMLGVVLLFVIIFFALMGIISMSMQKEKVTLKEKSILRINFSMPIKDRSSDNPFENLDITSFKTSTQPGLIDMVREIENAASDKNISGIFIDVAQVRSGYASLEELRNALIEFKKSKKFIIAYAEYYSAGAYYLASTADKIYMHPEGLIDFKGQAAQLMFIKGTLDKLEIEPQVIRHGKFKSAVEPYILDKMSDENRQQIGTLINDLWNNMLNQIAASRSIEPSELEIIADSFASQNAKRSLELKLIDGIAYYDEVDKVLHEKSGTAGSDKLNFISLKKYKDAPDADEKKYTKDKIAVIYAQGDIVDGKGEDDEVGSEPVAEAIRKARLDKNVKAIVLRINSPGGSAMASDVIWRETVLAKKEKPFIVSMGDLAASGGYYVSCAADTIVAQPGTITGSIGVFGLILNYKNLLNNKLGITFDTYKTGPYSDLGTPTRPLTAAERNIIQNMIEEIYGTFIKHVSEGRNISVADVDSIGQGRVWSAISAKQLKLVDVFGGLNDAIKIAAKKAGLDNYKLRELPEQKEPLEKLLSDLSGNDDAMVLEKYLGSDARYIEFIMRLKKQQGIQAWFPYEIMTE